MKCIIFDWLCQCTGFSIKNTNGEDCLKNVIEPEGASTCHILVIIASLLEKVCCGCVCSVILFRKVLKDLGIQKVTGQHK